MFELFVLLFTLLGIALVIVIMPRPRDVEDLPDDHWGYPGASGP